MPPAKLHINRAYANVYSDRRAREEKRKLEAHFGGSAKEVQKSETVDNDSDDDSDYSDSESDYDVKNSALDKGFWRTYGALSVNDPILYDNSKSLYTELESENNEDATKKFNTKTKPKKYFLKDHERDYLLYGENGENGESGNIEKMSNYNAKLSHSCEDNFASNCKEKLGNNVLIEYLKGNLDKVESDVVKHLAPIKEKLVASKKLTSLEEDREAFLIDFLVNKRWQSNGSEALASNDVDDDNFLELQEEYESKFNMQNIDPDMEFANKYPRAFGFEEKSESESGDDIFIEKCHTDSLNDDNDDEMERIRIKLGYSEKVGDLNGSGVLDNDKLSATVNNSTFAESNSSDKELLQTYPRNITETMRRSNKLARSEKRLALKERRRKEKETRQAELKLLQKLEHEHLQKRLHQIYSSAGFKKNAKNIPITADDLEEDFDPITHNHKMAQIFNDVYYCDANKEEKPEFSDTEDIGDFSQNSEAKKILQKIEELDEMEAEDFIDDVKCRFKYRQVPANNFGLSAEEILKANDKELNCWVSVKKMSQFRDKASEMKDFKKYNSNYKQSSKERILTSLFTPECETKVKERKKKREKSETLTVKVKKRKTFSSHPQINAATLQENKVSPFIANFENSDQADKEIVTQHHETVDAIASNVECETSANLSALRIKQLMKRKQKRLKKRNSKKLASNPANFVVEDRLKDLGFSSKKLKHMIIVKS